MDRDVVWYESDNPNGFRTGQRLSVDVPCATIMAEGLGGDSLGHWHLIWTGGQMLVASPEQMKPPYRVPNMAEIVALPWNGLMVASCFSGAGGSCLGYRMAGYRVVWASEFVPIAAESYRANAPETILDTRDIRTVTAVEILAATGLQVGELDLLDGSPPCQPFSTAGKREKTWGKQRDYGDHSQRADDLFFEYARLVRDLQPRTFVAENVSGLVKGTAKGYFKEILAALKACGYVVSARLLDAQWLGVPQMRQRIIFVGVRADLGRDPVFPTPLPYRYSVRDALPWITGGKYGAEWRSSDSESPTMSASLAYNPTTNSQGLELVESDVTPSCASLDCGIRLIQAGAGGRTSSSWGHGTCEHPTERRKFTIAELRRICAFSDDFVLCGSYAEQWARLGNAVPPLMMRAVAETIRDEILLKVARG